MRPSWRACDKLMSPLFPFSIHCEPLTSGEASGEEREIKRERERERERDVLSNLQPSPQLKGAPPFRSKVHVKGTTWCIHVAEWAKPAQNGLMALVCAPPTVGDHSWKRAFLTNFVTHFWSQNGTFSRHFGIFYGPKRVTTGSKRAEYTCLSIPSGLGTILEKIILFAPGTLVDPPLPPPCAGGAALRLQQVTTGTGV